MKIAIAGAHCVGKTTLAEELLEHLPGYVFYPEPYYELEASGYLFSEVPDTDDFIKQFDHSVKQITKGGDHIIFDRSPLDILAYIHALDPNKNIQAFFETVQKVLAGIDLLVFVPIEEPDLISSQPSDLPKLRHEVNEILHDWIWDLGIETIEVSGALARRRDQVLQKIT